MFSRIYPHSTCVLNDLQENSIELGYNKMFRRYEDETVIPEDKKKRERREDESREQEQAQIQKKT